MIDLRRSSPIRVHVHRRAADGCTTSSLLPARLPAGALPGWRSPADTHPRSQFGALDTLGAVTAYDDDWFAGRPATP